MSRSVLDDLSEQIENRSISAKAALQALLNLGAGPPLLSDEDKLWRLAAAFGPLVIDLMPTGITAETIANALVALVDNIDGITPTTWPNQMLYAAVGSLQNHPDVPAEDVQYLLAAECNRRDQLLTDPQFKHRGSYVYFIALTASFSQGRCSADQALEAVSQTRTAYGSRAELDGAINTLLSYSTSLLIFTRVVRPERPIDQVPALIDVVDQLCALIAANPDPAVEDQWINETEMTAIDIANWTDDVKHFAWAIKRLDDLLDANIFSTQEKAACQYAVGMLCQRLIGAMANGDVASDLVEHTYTPNEQTAHMHTAMENLMFAAVMESNAATAKGAQENDGAFVAIAGAGGEYYSKLGILRLEESMATDNSEQNVFDCRVVTARIHAYLAVWKDDSVALEASVIELTAVLASNLEIEKTRRAELMLLLVGVLTERHKVTGKAEDQQATLRCAEKLVELTIAEPDETTLSALDYITATHMLRFNSGHADDERVAALEAAKTALSLLPPDSPQRSPRLQFIESLQTEAAN